MKKLLSLAAGLLSLMALAAPLSASAAATPQFPGGADALKNYISDNMKYPQSAIDNGIEGIVDVAFTVKTDGSIGSIKIVRMIDPDLEAEAIRLVKSMPPWTPADKNGNPVEAQTQVQINFILP